MGLEQTLVIIKPEAIERGIEYEILNSIRRREFNIPKMLKIVAPEEVLREHYAEVIGTLIIKKGKEKGEKEIGNIIDYMTSGPVVIALIEGNNAISEIKKMCGESTEPIKCAPGTIRHEYSSDSFDYADSQGRSLHNVIHRSSSKEDAEKEINIWFVKYASRILGIAKKIEIRDCDKVSAQVRYRLADMFDDIMVGSNEKGMVYRGIDPAELERIRREGIAALPSNATRGLWTAGFSTFLPKEISPFFSHSRSETEHGVVYTIAAMDYASSRKEGWPEFKPDSSIYIPGSVGPEDFKIIQVRVSSTTKDIKGPSSISYENTPDDAAQRLLLDAMSVHLFGQTSPEGIISYQRQL